MCFFEGASRNLTMEAHLETLLQVETTMSKGIMRVTTTALGGGAAAAVMLRPVIATNPYILMVIILAFDFVVALFMLTQFKYAGAKFPQTLEHWSEQHRHGSWRFSYASCFMLF